MDHLLNFWIHSHHFGVEIWMILHEYVRIPCCRDEDGIDSASNRCHEDLANLQADEEAEGHHYGCKSPSILYVVSESALAMVERRNNHSTSLEPE